MKRWLLLLIISFSVAHITLAAEHDGSESVGSINHVVPFENSQTINPPAEEEVDYYSADMELRGSVIYDEGAKSIPDVELNGVAKPKIKLKTANMIIPVNEHPVKTDTMVNMPSRSAFSETIRIKGEDYCLIPVWSLVKETMGNFTYGTEYLTCVDFAQLETTMNIYTRYDFKHFAITGGLGSHEKRAQGFNDNVIKIAPEVKLTKTIAIRDTVQTYVINNIKKNKVSIIYTPKIKNSTETLWFELGFSNSFYPSGRVNSSVEFFTKFRL